jgi:hypothetical protein
LTFVFDHKKEIEGGKTVDESAQMFTNIISRNRGPKQRSFAMLEWQLQPLPNVLPLKVQIAKKVYFPERA